MTAKEIRAAILSATLGSMTIIAYQVAAKATRSALFLSNFPVTSLPLMTFAAALSSLLMVLLTAQAMAALGPAKLVPRAFWCSAVLHLVEWALFAHAPKPVAILFYVHFAAFGALLISGFWSVVNERFDPRTTKKHMGRIAGGGAAGALLGGLLTERVGATLPLAYILPALGALHFLGGAITVRLRRPQAPMGPLAETRGADSLDAGIAVLAKLPYLRNLALLVLAGAAGEQMIDYVFMARTAAVFRDGELLRVLALFNMGVSVVGFVIEVGVARRLLEKIGLGATMSVLPVTVAAGSVAALAVPGMASVALARGSQMIVLTSLFRHGHELFYTSVPPAEKRAAKPLIDVGFDRAGGIAGSLLTRLLLSVLPGAAQPVILTMAAGCGIAGLWFARQLDRGYVAALERSLRSRAVELNLEDVEDRTTRESLMRTKLPLGAKAPWQGERAEVNAIKLDPVVRRLIELRSGDPVRVRRALDDGRVDALLAAQVIDLLAWNDLADDAVRALQAAGPAFAGELIDAMIEDRGDNFAIRRRIPRVLSAFTTARAVGGLMLGLEDPRFEVRFRCGQALKSIVTRDQGLAPSSDAVLAAIARELELGKHIWESHQLLDGFDQDELVGERANRGLAHVFTLLSLILPPQAARICVQALRTDDEMLRGTAFEYLESTLPPTVWKRLWPYLAEGPSPEPTQRRREEILAELIRSHESLQMRLQEEGGGQEAPRTQKA